MLIFLVLYNILSHIVCCHIYRSTIHIVFFFKCDAVEVSTGIDIRTLILYYQKYFIFETKF